MKDFHRLAAVTLALAGLMACERSKTLPRADSGAPAPRTAGDTSAAATSPTWNPDVGPALLVAAAAPNEAFVLLPGDSASRLTLAAIPKPASATLLGRSGTVQTGEIPTIVDSGACTIASVGGAPPPHGWSVGFIGGVVAPIPVDSTESFSASDSAAAVASMNRLASALPNDSAGRFVGLPFVVHNLWRFKLVDGTVVVAANLTRQINQEATPLQEHTFLVAEHRPNDTTLTTAYYERSSGDEETIESADILAAVALGAPRQPALIVSRDFGDTIAFRILERVGPGRWRAGWSSPKRHC